MNCHGTSSTCRARVGQSVFHVRKTRRDRRSPISPGNKSSCDFFFFSFLMKINRTVSSFVVCCRCSDFLLVVFFGCCVFLLLFVVVVLFVCFGFFGGLLFFGGGVRFGAWHSGCQNEILKSRLLFYPTLYLLACLLLCYARTVRQLYNEC